MVITHHARATAGQRRMQLRAHPRGVTPAPAGSLPPTPPPRLRQTTGETDWLANHSPFLDVRLGLYLVLYIVWQCGEEINAT